MINTTTCGDCVKLIPSLEDHSVGLCVTSPPYANQRSGDSSTGAVLYSGVSEKDFPSWVVSWMEPLKKKLKPDASVFIVIRPHLREGEISDYTLRTRLALRENGWKECDELIWYKPDAPPLGSNIRPRRCWESVHWFSLTGKPYVDLYACGRESCRVGGFAGSERFGEGVIAAKNQVKTLKKGVSRVTDVISVAVGSLPKGVMHPAMYPGGLVDVLIQTFSRPGDVVLDPFMGSGQTGLSALSLGRNFVGMDCDPTYVELANGRTASINLSQFKEKVLTSPEEALNSSSVDCTTTSLP